MKRLVIDIGSYMTKIYMLGCGVVLAEPTCLAVEQTEEYGETSIRIKAYGEKAKALSGKLLNTRVVNPVVEGDIVNLDLLAPLMMHFFKKIEITPKQARNTEVNFILPVGAKEELKNKYRDLAELCDIGRIYFTPIPYAAVLGQNVTLSETTPVLSLDVGYGVTNITVFSLDRIYSGITVNLGGGNIDKHIMDSIADDLGIKITANTAESIKNEVGSLLDDDNRSLVVDGRDIRTGKPTSIVVNLSQILNIIKLYVDKILEYVSLIISELPSDVASIIMRGAVYISGGLAKMDGFTSYVSRRLDMRKVEGEEPSLASVIGGGLALSNDYLYSKATELG